MKRRQPYAEEFKQEAVKLVTEQGMGVTRVARDLDVSLDTLHRWLRVTRQAGSATTTSPSQAAELARLRREVEQLRLKRDILKKRSASSRACHNEAEICLCCRPREQLPGQDTVPGVGACAKWLLPLKNQPPTKRAEQDAMLTARIQTIFRDSRRKYGSPRVHATLQAQGVQCSKKRVARLMRAIACVVRRKQRRICTTDSRHTEPIAANELARHFQTEAPNQVWVADITYLPTRGG